MVRNKEEFSLNHLPGGKYERSWKGFLKELVEMTRYVSKYFFLAIVLAAAIPVIQLLAALGMSKGAVLTYFISGPVTKISNLVILQAAFKRAVMIQYLAIRILGAIVLGLLNILF
ncbi:MAG: hypothetical protein MUC93_03325 [Bacteroidales bacterium]|jgi:uncharacterized membrane protein YraQ (UPF0718 family)|nr:hypothetical protein [Bacteroidales bacterium]